MLLSKCPVDGLRIKYILYSKILLKYLIGGKNLHFYRNKILFYEIVFKVNVAFFKTHVISQLQNKILVYDLHRFSQQTICLSPLAHQKHYYIMNTMQPCEMSDCYG
jgi:hypothetical protein